MLQTDMEPSYDPDANRHSYVLFKGDWDIAVMASKCALAKNLSNSNLFFLILYKYKCPNNVPTIILHTYND